MTSNSIFRIATFLSLCLANTVTWSTQSQDSIDGEYTHRIRQCDGTINPTDCITTEEGLAVERRNASTYYLFAKTRSGSIFHFCEYSGVAKLQDDKLISGRKNHCEVTVSFKAGEAVLSSEGMGCRDFCSANASLNASNLKKKNRYGSSIGSTIRSGK